MKKMIVVIVVTFFSIQAKAEKKIVDSQIEKVTVYPVGAMIERTAQVSLTRGNQIVVLDNLTQTIDPNTIQVGGTGSFEILSVKFELFYPYAKSKPKGIEMIEDSLKQFDDQSFLLEAESRALDQEKQMILANQKIAGANSIVTVEKLAAMSKFYRLKLSEINEEKLRNKNNRKRVEKEVLRLKSTLSGMNQYKYEQVGRIQIETNVSSNTRANLKFSYFTHLAGWTPRYNIKAKTGKDQIDVDYHAMVTQSTGVDWNNLDLILSTSRPTYNNQKPEVHPWYLDFMAQSKLVSKGNNGRTDGYYVSSDLEMEEAPEARNDVALGNTVYENGQYKALSAATYSWGQELMNALNTSYQIAQKYSVPSNKGKKQVFIKSIEIPAEFNHYSVPSKEKESFLTASIADWGSYDLVAGNATLFYNGTYVGKSYINSNTTDDTLQISLGRDQGVMLTQEKVQDLCHHKKMGNNIKKNFVYEIVAKNTNKEAITIVIFDRVPVSKKNEIEVTLGSLDDAELDKETGIIKWKKTIPSGASINLRFDYEVKYPKDKRVNI